MIFSMVNFTGNDTAAQLGAYMNEGLLTAFGDPTLLAGVILLVVLMFCYFARLPMDASAFLLLFIVMILGLTGFLPLAVFFFALIIDALVIGLFLFKVFGFR